MIRRAEIWCMVAAVLFPQTRVAAGSDEVQLRIDPSTARLVELAFGTCRVPLVGAEGGFVVRDFGAQHSVALDGSVVEGDSGTLCFTASSDDLSLWAKFTPADGFVRVAGEIRSDRPAERAIELGYLLPLQTEGAVFEDELSHSTPLGPGRRALGTVYPLAAMTGGDWGVALAIPPTFPCCFALVGSTDGLGVEFYLGLSPQVRKFPRRAEFHFVIYAAKPGWGFRSSLARYYQLYTSFYAPRFSGGGFWNWQEKGDIDHALPLYRVQGITRTRTFYEEIQRNRRFGVLSFDYVMVGQRELKHLPELPAGYENAMKVFAEFARTWRAHPDGTSRRQYPHWRDRDLPELIQRCACKQADGRYRIQVRRSVWAGNSITFTMNPNPALFADKSWDVVGSTTLRQVDSWFEQDPIDGIMVDSLGAQWPGALNYRRDHFVYAQYPLTFDKAGRVALHNRISHYEFVEELRRLAQAKDKYVFANGIYRYRRPSMTEHFNGVHNGRFFLAALLDAAGREQTRLFTRQELEFFRTCMGRKLYAALLYKWQDREIVERQLNRALPYAVFAGPNRCFIDGVSYLSSPDGFHRDEELLQWFIKNCRMLFDAGWQPVTHATVNCPDIACERYGAGDVLYFALVNFGKQRRTCRLTIDFEALGMSRQDGQMPRLAELVSGASLSQVPEGNLSKLTLELEPDKARILKLSRAD